MNEAIPEREGSHETGPSRPTRGKLKIYIGMAAGVGKTYRMLSDAIIEKSKGLDVFAGYIEPHGRPEVQALADKIPSLPTKEILHHGLLVNEFEENAGKHTPEETNIRITANKNGRWIDIVFENNGPPLPPGMEEKIFEKHFRTSSAEGFGLGLFISRAIVRAHGGELTAKNREGGGVSFLIRLPFSPPPKIEAIDE